MRFCNSKVYTDNNHWDCVATCFFIDCANNVVQFIETIYNILKPGGVWINLGPLLYHFSDMPTEDSIEPSYAILRDVILGFGFTFEVNSSFSIPVLWVSHFNLDTAISRKQSFRKKFLRKKMSGSKKAI